MNALCFTDNAWHSLETGGGHARLSLSDKLHWHSVLDDEVKYNLSYVKRRKSDTCYSAVNKSKVQPSSDTFVILKLKDTKCREWLPCQFKAAKTRNHSVWKLHCWATKTAHTLWRIRSCIHIQSSTQPHIESVCVGACEKRLPPPLREHRKLETIPRLHAGFSSKLFSPQQPASEQPSTRLHSQHIR